ncbi:MAG: hypothetical protein U0521_05155 [Anaerolineae bacterium]
MEMTVSGVTSGTEALRLVEEEPVDLLVMDSRLMTCTAGRCLAGCARSIMPTARA